MHNVRLIITPSPHNPNPNPDPNRGGCEGHRHARGDEHHEGYDVQDAKPVRGEIEWDRSVGRPEQQF